MTHRDGFPRLSARSAWRGDAGHRKPRATTSESLGKPPLRSRRRTAGGRRKALTMSRIARSFPPTRPLARRIACPISMGHYQRSLVLTPWKRQNRRARVRGRRWSQITAKIAVRQCLGADLLRFSTKKPAEAHRLKTKGVRQAANRAGQRPHSWGIAEPHVTILITFRA